MIGIMSGVQGRSPIQGSGSTRSPSGKKRRATGSARASWTGVLGASRFAHSPPVVTPPPPPPPPTPPHPPPQKNQNPPPPPHRAPPPPPPPPPRPPTPSPTRA